MSKHKHQTKKQAEQAANFAEVAGRVGAWVLTAAALLATSEKLMHAELAALPASNHQAFVRAEPETIRAEGARESARLPEEYDIGLRAPAITGA